MIISAEQRRKRPEKGTRAGGGHTQARRACAAQIPGSGASREAEGLRGGVPMHIRDFSDRGGSDFPHWGGVVS